MDLKRQINGCLFMSMIFILVQIEFDIVINIEKQRVIDIGGGA
jgi:hypothetical protein